MVYAMPAAVIAFTNAVSRVSVIKRHHQLQVAQEYLELTSQQNLLHAAPLRRAVPLAMTKLILAFAKAETDAFRDLLQQRRLVATVLPTYVEDLVGDLLCLLACLHWV